MKQILGFIPVSETAELVRTDKLDFFTEIKCIKCHSSNSEASFLKCYKGASDCLKVIVKLISWCQI